MLNALNDELAAAEQDFVDAQRAHEVCLQQA